MEASQSTSEVVQVTSPSPSATDQLKQMLSQARATREMLQAFKAAIDDCQVHGSKVYALAIGVQFLGTLISQSAADVQNLQAKIESEHKKPEAVA